MEEEIWKDIPEYEGSYQASNLGRIRSLDRFRPNHQCGSGFVKEGVLIQGYINKKHGYHTVGLSFNNVSATFYTHKLVILSFYGIKSDNNIVIDHINRIKTDNRLINLQVITQSENIRKAIDKSNTYSVYFGVYKGNRDGKWRARIKINNEQISLGQKDDEYEASKLYDLAFNNKHLYKGDKKQFKEQINKLNISK